MSRSGYSDDCDGWDLIRWRGAVNSALRGSRGQAVLVALRDALDSMPEKKLIAGELITPTGEVCALGRLAQVKGISVDGVDPENRHQVAKIFDIAPALAAEIVHENDECYCIEGEDPDEKRWIQMRAWVESNIKRQT